MTENEVAYHEAGHAIVRAALGILRNDSVTTIIPSKNSGGLEEIGSVSISERFGFHDSGKTWGKRYAQNLIIATYAGPATSTKLDPTINLLDEGGYCVCDLINASGLKRDFVGTDDSLLSDHYLHYAKERTWRKAVALVENYWPAITALAKQLLIHKTITGKEAKAILKKSATAGFK